MPAAFLLHNPAPSRSTSRPLGGGAPSAAGWPVGLTVFMEPPQEGLCLLAILA